MSETTTIKVSMKTRDALKVLGRMGESYDVVIKRLIFYYAETQVKQDPEALKKLLYPEEEGEG